MRLRAAGAWRMVATTATAALHCGRRRRSRRLRRVVAEFEVERFVACCVAEVPAYRGRVTCVGQGAGEASDSAVDRYHVERRRRAGRWQQRPRRAARSSASDRRSHLVPVAAAAGGESPTPRQRRARQVSRPHGRSGSAPPQLAGGVDHDPGEGEHGEDTFAAAEEFWSVRPEPGVVHARRSAAQFAEWVAVEDPCAEGDESAN